MTNDPFSKLLADDRPIPFEEVEAAIFGNGEPQYLPGTQIDAAQAQQLLTSHPMFREAPTAFSQALGEYNTKPTTMDSLTTLINHVAARLEQDVRETEEAYEMSRAEVIEALEATAVEEAEYEAEMAGMELDEAIEQYEEARQAEALQVANDWIEQATADGLHPEVISGVLRAADGLMEDSDMNAREALDAVIRLGAEKARVEAAANEPVIGTGFTARELQEAFGGEVTVEGANEAPDFDWALTGQRKPSDVVEEGLAMLQVPQRDGLIQDRQAIEEMAQRAADAQAAADARQGSAKTGYRDPAERQGTTLGQFLESEGISMGAPVSDPVTPDAPVDISRAND